METLVSYPHHVGPAAFPWSSAMIASHTPPQSRPSTVDSTPADNAQHPPSRAAPASVPHNAAAADPASVQSPASVSGTPNSDLLSNADSASSPPSPPRIKVKSLQHIQSFASEDLEKMACSHSTSYASLSEADADADAPLPQYEISEMPVTDVIEMVAGLLTKITSTNDRQHEQMHSQVPSTDGALSSHAASVLSFHGKNIPSITIMSYLSRIHKYCPATYEVFLSLLVYFDRMTDKVNAGPLRSLQKAHQQQVQRQASQADTSPEIAPEESQSSGVPTPTPPSSVPASAIPSSSQLQNHPTPPSPPLSETEPYSLSDFFVVDSYNIHRLVIAGVTCASKFFSDVFYTNSRYAKVGGLPLPELNHLELQFLLLNDFRLSIAVEELEAYATMLVAFYAREVVSQRKEGAMEDVQASPVVHAHDASQASQS